MIKTIFAIVLSTMIAGCATSPGSAPLTPQQIIDGARIALAAADLLEAAYVTLPPCGDDGPKACSRAEIVSDIQVARASADGALDAFETAINTQGFGSDAATTALATLRASLQAYTKTAQALRARQAP